MGAAASRRFLTLSNVLRIIYSDEIHHAYTGWHGVGMSMAAKAVAKAARQSPDLFDVVVLVTAGEECSADIGKLQRKIAAQLGFFDVGGGRRKDDDDGDDGEDLDREVARIINRSLASRNFLLIIENLLTAHDLGMMGIPTVSEWTRSKILITTPHPLVIGRMNIRATIFLLSTDDEEAWFQVHFGGVDELLAHFRDEAGDVANTLGINHEVDQIFNCFIYLCLFQQTTSTSTSMDAKELMKYYMGEGFITTATTASSQQTDDIDDLDGAFRHGEAILEEMVARYMVEDRSSSAAGGDGRKFSMNSHLWEILDGRREGRRYLKEKLHIRLEGNMLEDDAAARWVSLSHNKIQPSIPIGSRPWCAKQLTTLLLNDNRELKQIPSTFFDQIPNLKVLDLSRTSISSFPPSLSSLIRLRFLKLQECPYLNTLPPSLKQLKQLIILDLRGSPLSDSIPSEALKQKTNLRLVDLSHTKVNHSLMPSLLSSLCDLNLERLLLAGCNSFVGMPLLMSMSSSHHHQLIRRLPELDISSCYGALKEVENVSFQDLPKLRALNLSHTPIARLSITRCTSLENVHLQGLTNLKSLHLSSIRIKKFPHEISEMTSLEQLHLSDVKQLRKVDWEKLHWLPEKLEWDECSCCSSSRRPAAAASGNSPLQLQEELGGGENRGGRASISVSNADIFRGLSFSSLLWDNAFSKFHFSISPCLKQCGEKGKKTRGVDVGQEKRTAIALYADICSKMSHLHLPDHALLMRRRIDFSRHLKIEGAVPVASLFYWRGDSKRSLVETVVRRAEVLWLRENRGSVESLSDLKVEEMVDLKECWVERCHDMEHIFPESLNKDIRGPSQRLWVSELGSLRSVYNEDNDFLSLKHLHIQCCVKLETLFHFYPTLPQLETLHIRFCYRLKSIFRGHHIVDGEYAFPKLHVLRLWELPQLKYICRGSLLSLEHFRVRACPCLQQLPYLDSQNVKIKID